ncbi:MAG: NUDIX domain-containing protein [Clostridia bacterium]|nr:NUDIX domain-containing protein [Clostridia bacterium]
MKQLFAIDLHDYDEADSVFKRPSARGIILRDDNIALVYSLREHYYKFPGGGIHDGEDQQAALIREVQEETGLIVIPESITPFGSVMRRQKSNIVPHTVFEQENFYYFCRAEATVTQQHLDDYEKDAGFTLQYVSLDEAIRVNEAYRSEDFFDEIMIQREAKVLRMIRDRLKQDGFPAEG